MTARLPLCLGLTVALGPQPARACATFYQRAAVAAPLAEERALVAWDAAAKREHFVRSVRFDPPALGPPAPIAFVVPTPSAPEIAEADDALFSRLEHAAEPEIVTEVEHPIQWALLMRTKSAVLEASAAAPVVVVGTAHVAGFDAVSLRADDSESLTKWLSEHDFVAGPDTGPWLAPYVQQHWVVTAFRFAPGPNDAPATSLSSRAIRLSFGTDQPVWPYREPEGAPVPGARSMRAYVVASERRDAKAEDGHAVGTVEFAGPIDASVLGAAAPGLAGPLWLTAIHDDTLVRSGGELLFPVAASAAGYRRQIRQIAVDPIVIPLDVIGPVVLLLGVPALLLGLARRRRLP